jgi:hypothetical protein
MRLLPSSARRRRRLAYLVAALLIALGVGVLNSVLPHGGAAPQSFSSNSGPPAPTERQVPLAGADRKAINALLDRFVPAAIERRHPLAAWELAAPSMRGQVTRRQWAAGNVPVMPYPARGTRFHDWTVAYSYADRVGLDLGLRPRPGARIGVADFPIEVRRYGRRWLIYSIYARVIYPR